MVIKKTKRNRGNWAEYRAHKKELKEKKKVKIYSKRGVRLKGVYKCFKCDKEINNPMQYTDTSKGPIFLCDICKPNKNKWVDVVQGGSPGQGKK